MGDGLTFELSASFANCRFWEDTVHDAGVMGQAWDAIANMMQIYSPPRDSSYRLKWHGGEVCDQIPVSKTQDVLLEFGPRYFRENGTNIWTGSG